jgi:hypothetical protein
LKGIFELQILNTKLRKITPEKFKTRILHLRHPYLEEPKAEQVEDRVAGGAQGGGRQQLLVWQGAW